MGENQTLFSKLKKTLIAYIISVKPFKIIKFLVDEDSCFIDIYEFPLKINCKLS
jgi:hypothetical protein